MRVKRYIVNTLPDAVQLIRNELGKDAVILETKEVKVGGFLGLFRTKKIEVLAAVEPNKQTSESTKKNLEKTDVDLVIEEILKASQKSKDVRKVEISSDVNNIKPVLNQNIENTVKPVQEAVPNLFNITYNSSKQQPQSKSHSTMDIEAVLKSTEKAVHSAKEQNEEQLFASNSPMSNTEQFILKELKHLRLEMKAFSEQRNEKQAESAQINILRNHLIEQELNDEWINTLCEMLQEHEAQQNRALQSDEVWELARKQLLEWLKPFSEATIDQTTKVIQLVGPTGVGKTTTIAKLAASYSITSNKKVGLITADTYRIAAIEQLRTYANILNLPLEVVFTASDLPRAYRELEHSDIIIMDTAGRNFKSDLFVSEVNSLIANTQFSEGVLVVSLTSRTKDMAIVAEKFGKFGVKKVVFTKLDEANAYGSIFNMIMQYGLQPLFVTSGQNVPDDMEPFTTSNYVNLLLGEVPHE